MTKETEFKMPTCMFDLWNRFQTGEFYSRGTEAVSMGNGYVSIVTIVHMPTGKVFYTFIDETENYAPYLKNTKEQAVKCWEWYCKEVL